MSKYFEFSDFRFLMYALPVNWWGWLYKYLNKRLQLNKLPPPLFLKSNITFWMFFSFISLKLSLKNRRKFEWSKEKLFTLTIAVLLNIESKLKFKIGLPSLSNPLYLFLFFNFFAIFSFSDTFLAVEEFLNPFWGWIVLI